MCREVIAFYGRGDLHFPTFSCYQRLEFLGTKSARNLFVSELARVRREYGFRLAGYVVMPNHVHLLVSEPSKGHGFHGAANVKAARCAEDAQAKEGS